MLRIIKTEILSNLSLVLQTNSTRTATMTRIIIQQKPFIVLSYYLKTIILRINELNVYCYYSRDFNHGVNVFSSFIA